MQRSGTAAVMVVVGLLMSVPALQAAPAEAPCVYLGLGCDAPPLPAPNFPDALVPPIAVPAALGPALGAPPLAAAPPAFDAEPSALVHHRHRHHRARRSAATKG